jgi:hypothetical protein
MNERIQELHQQAKDFINEVSDRDGVYQGKEYMQAVREKFAELIVRECIAELETSKRCDPYTGDLFTCEYNDCLDDQIAMLKEEFGVTR